MEEVEFFHKERFWPFGKMELKKSADAILEWDAEKLIIAHGACVENGASEVIKNSLYWVWSGLIINECIESQDNNRLKALFTLLK